MDKQRRTQVSADAWGCNDTDDFTTSPCLDGAGDPLLAMQGAPGGGNAAAIDLGPRRAVGAGTLVELKCRPIPDIAQEVDALYDQVKLNFGLFAPASVLDHPSFGDQVGSWADPGTWNHSNESRSTWVDDGATNFGMKLFDYDVRLDASAWFEPEQVIGGGTASFALQTSTGTDHRSTESSTKGLGGGDPDRRKPGCSLYLARSAPHGGYVDDRGCRLRGPG